MTAKAVTSRLLPSSPRRLRLGPLGVDAASALDLVGRILKYVSLAFSLPAVIAVGYGEPVWPFLVSALATAGSGFALERITGSATAEGVEFREAFLVIALVWLLVPAFGALPFLLADVEQLENPINAYFESVSGFTASGATVLRDIEAIDRSILMWRQFSHWLGGMGIMILAVAVLPRLRVGGRQLLHSELAGPTELERLTTTVRKTARRLWLLYVALTILAIAVLALLGWTGADPAMNLFDAAAHAFSVLALGGFSTQNRSIEAFGAVTQWTLLVFMLLAGFNFLRLYRLFVQRAVRSVSRDEELRLYLAFLAGGSVLLVLEVVEGAVASGEAAVRTAVFQGVSVMTTTGFATADYTQWGALAQMTLLLLMFVGASAGSTGGSIKVVRHLLFAKVIRRELHQTVHPELVVPIRVNGLVVGDRALRSAMTFVVLYIAVFAIAAVALVIDARRADVEIAAFEAIGAAAACLGNVGPGFGFAGPFGSYGPFSDLSTVILTVLMWLGRLEIIPVAVLLTRSYWRA